ncbi:MAG: ion channel [Archaeoglobaceae archaeon]
MYPLIYYFGKGVENAKSFLDYLHFSTATATTLGYGDLKPALTTITIPGTAIQILFRILAAVEAIFGSFMWATFLVVFSRKFMRL